MPSSLSPDEDEERSPAGEFDWRAVTAERLESGACVLYWACFRFYSYIKSRSVMQTPANPEFLRRAIRLATQNVVTGAGGPFGAVVMRGGRIVAEGVNTVTATLDPTAHAEVNAIRAAAQALGSFTLTDCQLYTSCEPCPMCLAAAYWARIEAIYYGASSADAARAGFDDVFIYEELRRASAERKLLPATQLLGEEAWASFAAWIASASKVAY
jgi:tRNA(Arg) A34 adenosine deaminase TadA